MKQLKLFEESRWFSTCAVPFALWKWNGKRGVWVYMTGKIEESGCTLDDFIDSKELTDDEAKAWLKQ